MVHLTMNNGTLLMKLFNFIRLRLNNITLCYFRVSYFNRLRSESANAVYSSNHGDWHTSYFQSVSISTAPVLDRRIHSCKFVVKRH